MNMKPGSNFTKSSSLRLRNRQLHPPCSDVVVASIRTFLRNLWFPSYNCCRLRKLLVEFKEVFNAAWFPCTPGVFPPDVRVSATLCGAGIRWNGNAETRVMNRKSLEHAIQCMVMIFGCLEWHQANVTTIRRTSAYLPSE